MSSAGDVNGDGLSDIIIGGIFGLSNWDGSAKSYIIYGSAIFNEPVLELNELDGSNGFTIKGLDLGDQTGSDVSNAGDINGDGLSDFIIGLDIANENAGKTYVVFGDATFNNSSLDLNDLDGSNGFIINGIKEGDQSGFSVSSAGDVNGDGISDIIMGANQANNTIGQSYVIFGGVTVDSLLSSVESDKFITRNIQLLPNPADLELVILLDEIIRDTDWRILSQEGTVVLSGHINRAQENHSIDTSHLKEGIYFISYENEQIQFVKQRFVVIH